MREGAVTQPPDPVNHPAHYVSHPSGVECIEIARHFSFNCGNALKYIWRSGLKDDDPVVDLKKAIFYLQDEICRLSATGHDRDRPARVFPRKVCEHE
jgi:hypothetical protein